MKFLTTLLLTLLCVSVFTTVNAQNENLNIDPRQYITVFEINKVGFKKKQKDLSSTENEKIKVWEWSKAMPTSEKRKIIDASSIIQIEFNRDSIASNKLFKGNITIEGKIVSDKGGEDPVEVFPYSRIGEEKKRVGVTTRPSTEIAKIFVNLLTESLKATRQSTLNVAEERFRYNLINKILEAKSVIRKFKEFPKNDLLSDENKYLIGVVGSDEDEMGFDSGVNFFLDFGTKDPTYKIATEQLGSLITRIQNTINESIKRNQSENDWFQRLRHLDNDAKIILDYINYFKSSGEQAEDVFLSFINLDHLNLDNIESQLRFKYDILHKYIETTTKQVYPNASTSEDSIQEKYKVLYVEIIEEIGNLTQLQGTLIYEKVSTIPDPVEPHDRNWDPYEYNIDDFYKKIIANKKETIDIIALEASKIIYLNLDYATIDLLKERGNEGQYLYLYVVLEENQRRSKTTDEKIYKKVLPIGRYELRNTGWRTSVAGAFSLINRLKEPDPATNPDVSPSNFKGSPGSSLMLTRRRDGNIKHKFWNSLEPSMGINLSYIDFNRNDDIEVGVGAVLGLFDNKVFFSGGINLNSTGTKEVSPYYFSLGFNFTDLGSIFKNKSTP